MLEGFLSYRDFLDQALKQQAKDLLIAETVVGEHHYGQIRKLHRAGMTADEIRQHMGLNVTTNALYLHARKHMGLSLHKGHRTRVHRDGV